MLAFDLETTGLDVETVRIVTACTARIEGGRADACGWLVNPGVPIPAGATAVNGITDATVRENGRPPVEAVDEIAHAVAKALSDGTPVVGMNLAYDFTILDRECRRNGLPTVDDRLDGKPLAPVIDVFVLDKAIDRYRKGGRKLVDLCQHYRVRIDGAHDATQDAIAAARVAWKIAAENPALAAMSLTDLHARQVTWAAEQGANFAQYLRRLANEKVHEAGKAHAAGDVERQEIAQQEADELFARVDAMDGAWPLRLYVGGA